MRLSRLRVRLAATFALSFLAVLGLLYLTLYAYLRAEFNHRFSQLLEAESRELAVAINIEQREPHAPVLDEIARAVLEEWPTREFGLAVLDSTGIVVATGGSPRLAGIMAGPLVPGGRTVWELPGDDHPVRLATSTLPGLRGFRAVVAASTESVVQEGNALFLWLLISAPIAILLSLVAGYFLVARALQPVRELGSQVAELDVNRLDGRLPINTFPDELDALATQFNALLDRLAGFRESNRKFLRQAAHQIRTPLTVVLGEASLDGTTDRELALQRIRLAAEQMRRRVDDLFLLAQARSGEAVGLDQDVELDGLALESTDLMRGRFTGSGHHLELAEAAPVVVRGDEGLLREALIELLENACRHGDRAAPVRVGTRREDGVGAVWVESGGAPIPQVDGHPFQPSNEDHGVGLQVVQWITEQHHGTLQIDRNGGLNRVWIRIPVKLETQSSMP